MKHRDFSLHQRIVLNNIPFKDEYNINERLQWFACSLGLFGVRDRDKSCFRVFVQLVKAGSKDEMRSSDELSEELALSRATVIHHLNKLMDLGLVVNRRSKYGISASSFQTLVERVRRDAKGILDRLERVAKKLDEEIRY
jgi:predicted transcriptional regulator